MNHLNNLYLDFDNLRDGPVAPISGWVLGVARKIDSDILSSPNFYWGSKSPKFGFDFRHQSLLMRSDLETEQRNGNGKRPRGHLVTLVHGTQCVWPWLQH